MKRSELIFTRAVSEAFLSYCENNRVQSGVVIVDANTESFCLPLLNSTFPHIVIPAGELSKNLNTLEFILRKFLELQVDRQTVIFNLGGGVVSDIGGFAASIYKRGLRYVNIPTTLLAMVDAAIGGKTGIDYHDFKNYLGVFNVPEAVIISEIFLDTLPADELNSAWAEVIKTGVMCSAEIVGMIQANAARMDIITATATCKEEIVAQDFRDENIRQVLNFGHTIGHAFESYRLSIQQPVMHGIAVAKGMLFETRLALKSGDISKKDAQAIINLICNKMACDELTPSEIAGLSAFLPADKKNSGDSIVFSLPTGIGRGTYGIKLSAGDIKI